MKLQLVSGRTLDQGKTRDKKKLSQDYTDAAALVELDGDDADEIGVDDGDLARLETESGEITVPVTISRGDSSGVAFVPMGPWANALISGETDATGMPEFKCVQVEVEEGEGSPTTLDDMLGA